MAVETAEMLNMEGDWEKQENAVFWPNKDTKMGDEVSGQVLSAEDGKFGKNYTIQREDGSLICTKSQKALTPRMAKVKVGDIIKIVYKGTAPSGKGNPTNLFEVFIKKQ